MGMEIDSVTLDKKRELPICRPKRGSSPLRKINMKMLNFCVLLYRIKSFHAIDEGAFLYGN